MSNTVNLNRIEARKIKSSIYKGKECDTCGRANRRTSNGSCVWCKEQEHKYITRNNEVLSMRWSSCI